MNTPQWLEAWQAHLQQTGAVAETTRRQYLRDVQQFLAFYATHASPDEPATPWDSGVLHRYIVHLHEKGLQARTLKRYLVSVRHAMDYALSECGFTQTQSQEIRTPKIRPVLPAILEPDSLQAMLQSPAQDFLQARDLAMAELLYSSGLRVSELQAIATTDFEADTSLIRVTGKRQKMRLVPVGSAARTAQAQYGRFRELLLTQYGTATDHWFLNHRAQPLTVRSIQLRIRALGARAGHKLHPHLLRHCFASHLLGNSGDLRAVQEMLGHSNLNSTAIYTHLAVSQLAKVYDQCHPRAHREPPLDHGELPDSSKKS